MSDPNLSGYVAVCTRPIRLWSDPNHPILPVDFNYPGDGYR